MAFQALNHLYPSRQVIGADLWDKGYQTFAYDLRGEGTDATNNPLRTRLVSGHPNAQSEPR